MQYYVYIMTNNYRNVFYTGVTNNLIRRVYEHKEKLVEGFTKKYKLDRLVYFEIFSDPKSAIEREKQIKAGTRRRKIELVEFANPTWRDLWNEVSATK
ncbi:GIY-YIG nuclease family protein [bacterium]|nr:GIY-YIG nuclease family protein [bacterium]